MAVRVKEEVKEEVKEPCKTIYCGPNVPGLTQFTVLEGIPNYIKMHIDACIAIEKLIVPIDKLNQTRLKLSVKGSYEQRMYLEIQKYLRGEK